MNIALVLLLVAGAPPDAAKTQKAKDHVSSIQASVKTLEAEVRAAGGPATAGCAGERLTELRTLLSTAEKAAAAIQSAADADTADAQYGRIATARSKAQRLRDEADGCLKVAAAASGKKSGAKVAAKSANAKANGGGGKGAPADAKGAAGAASGAQLAANDPSRTGDGSTNGKGAAGETGGKAGATKAGATSAAGQKAAAAKVAATDEGSGNGDSLKSEDRSGRDSADAGSALQQMTLTGGRTETVAGPGARAQTDAGGAVNVRTGSTALASAPVAQAAPPPPPPPAPPPARTSVSGSDLVRKAGDHLSRIKTSMQRVLSKVEESRNAKDVVKLNCVYEKLAQIKQLLSSAEGAEVALQEALARDTGDGDAEYSRIAMARGKAEGLNQDAEGCVGQLALVVDSTTEVEVVQPEAVASTTAGTKLETAFGVISIGEDSSSTSTSSTSSTSTSTTDNSAYGSSLGYGGTTGTSSGGAPPPPPPPPVVRPQPASAF